MVPDEEAVDLKRKHFDYLRSHHLQAVVLRSPKVQAAARLEDGGLPRCERYGDSPL